MTLRARPLPVLALLLAAATALALSVALQRPAAALVSADPEPDDGTCETNGRVNAVAYIGDTLYLGGSFTAGGRDRPATGWRPASPPPGPCSPWNPDANGVVRALTVSPAGTRVFVGGDFTAVGGVVTRPGGRPQPDQRRRLRLRART